MCWADLVPCGCVGFGSPAVAIVDGIDAGEIAGTLWGGLISVESVAVAESTTSLILL